jgi:hypothetical protein
MLARDRRDMGCRSLALRWDAWAELGWDGLWLVLVALFLRRLRVVLALRRPMGGTWAHTVWPGRF